MITRPEAIDMLISNYGMEKEKVSKMSTAVIFKKLSDFQNGIQEAAARVETEVSELPETTQEVSDMSDFQETPDDFLQTFEELKAPESPQIQLPVTSTEIIPSVEQTSVPVQTKTKKVAAVKEVKEPKKPRVAETDPYVLGFKVTVPATGKERIYALKYGFQDFQGKPYCQMIVGDEEINKSNVLFVRTYNTQKTAEEHQQKFLSVEIIDKERMLERRDPAGYIGLILIRLSEIKKLAE